MVAFAYGRARTVALLTMLVTTASFPVSAAAPDDKTQARALFQQGSAAFHQQDYDRAIQLFSRAYELDPAGALLLNIAQAHRLKRPSDCAAALRYYELYLAAEPRAPERPEVEAHVESMRLCLAASAVAPAPAPPSDAPERPRVPPSNLPPPERASVRGPLWIGGAGIAAAAGGGITYLLARRRYDQLRPTCPCPDDVVDRWETRTRLSYGLMAGGGLLLSGALAWWWADAAARPSQERAGLRLWLSPSAVGLATAF